MVTKLKVRRSLPFCMQKLWMKIYGSFPYMCNKTKHMWELTSLKIDNKE